MTNTAFDAVPVWPDGQHVARASLAGLSLPRVRLFSHVGDAISILLLSLPRVRLFSHVGDAISILLLQTVTIIERETRVQVLLASNSMLIAGAPR